MLEPGELKLDRRFAELLDAARPWRNHSSRNLPPCDPTRINPVDGVLEHRRAVVIPGVTKTKPSDCAIAAVHFCTTSFL